MFGTTVELAQGGYAEGLCVRESANIATLPLTVDFEQGAAAPAGGLTAMQLLRRRSSVRSALPPGRPQDLRRLRDLLATGMVRSVIDRRHALSEIRDAHRYVEEGHKRGNVVISIAA
jgi:NADPH:quinone reductase-like Zn-dependent oxidoreductase